jgi:damage-control phosphatase, subfamily I
MKTYLDCIPCFIRQAYDAVSFTSNDLETREKVLREVLLRVGSMNLDQPPPIMGRFIHQLIKKLTDNDDPYRAIKEKYNNLALQMYPDLKMKVEQSDNPIETAIRLAIAGNIIDFGARTDLNRDEIPSTIDEALAAPFDRGLLKDFIDSVNKASMILYIGDNAGEIVFDRLLVEQLPREKIVFVVRGQPIINDATISDARAIGLSEIVTVIDNGSDAPGTIVSDCSEEFLDYFNRADIIIAKGQGNFETLNDSGKGIYFLLKAKCPVIARHLNCKLGAIVFIKK